MNVLQYVDIEWAKNRELSGRRVDQFYASEASIVTQNMWGESVVHGKCLRAQWYRMTRTAAPPAQMDTRRMDYGNAVHTHEVQRFSQARILKDAEVAFYDEDHNISGRVDAIIFNPLSATTPQEMMGVEIKSVGGYRGVYGVILPEAGKEIAPRVEHVLQCMAYQGYYKRKRGLDLKWLIHYHSRDSGQSAEHVIVLLDDGVSVNGQQQPWTLDGIYARWELLKGFLECGQVPPRDYALCYDRSRLLSMLERQQLNKTHASAVRKNKPIDLGDKQCSWCDYKAVCHAEM